MRRRLWPFLAIVSLVANLVLGSALYFGVNTRHAISALMKIPTPVPGLIACWGDSLTAGAGAEFRHDFPNIIGNTLGREVFNGGVGSETSTQIKQRMLARVFGLDSGVTIIWAGRNDYEESEVMLKNIGEMVASLPSDAHYFVLGILNGDYDGEARGEPKYRVMMKINERLATAYGNHYLPIREYLVSRYDRTDAYDAAAITRDIVPASLRTDRVHLNGIGYGFVAAYIAQEIHIRGW